MFHLCSDVLMYLSIPVMGKAKLHRTLQLHQCAVETIALKPLEFVVKNEEKPFRVAAPTVRRRSRAPRYAARGGHSACFSTPSFKRGRGCSRKAAS